MSPILVMNSGLSPRGVRPLCGQWRATHVPVGPPGLLGRAGQGNCGPCW